MTGCAGSCKDWITGEEHEDGAVFTSSDGCNKCFCADGVLGCTRMSCLPPRGKYRFLFIFWNYTSDFWNKRETARLHVNRLELEPVAGRELWEQIRSNLYGPQNEHNEYN